MNKDFWLSRWHEGKIGFHLGEVNELLVRYEPRLAEGGPRRVLVPLCGKSLDMRWLVERGHEVVGVELAEIAVRAFFTEQQIAWRDEHRGGHLAVSGGGVTLIVSDFSSVSRADVAPLDAVYDRAALVALPPAERPRYVRHLLSLLEPGARILLVTCEYDDAQMGGPPYCVSRDEVRRLYDGCASLELLEDGDILDAEPRFRQRGLTWLREAVWLITP